MFHYIKEININIYLLLVLLYFTTSCQDRDAQLKDVGFWKYSDGIYIGDALIFKSGSYKIQGDTIFKNNVPIALFDKIENRSLIGDKLLYIKDLKDNEIGVYISK